MLIVMAQLFGKKGAQMPVLLVEQNHDASDYPDVVEFLQPVKIEGTLTNEDEIFVLEANCATEIALECSRCLAPVKQKICFELKERFAHTGIEDEETQTFSGDQIDLTLSVRRGILEALPMRVLCHEDCLGLCPACGHNLNDGECGCDTTERDPRFDGLLGLFDENEEV